MGTFILIILISGSNKATSLSVEFSSQEKCETAASAVKKAMSSYALDLAVCVKK